MTQERRKSRRRLLRTSAATIGLASMAGCASLLDLGGSDEDDLRSISVGETREGYVDQGDGNDPEYGDLAEPVSLDADGGQGVEIAMESSEFDTFLLMTASNGRLVGQNDDGPSSGTDSLIRLVTPESGSYTIWAGSLSGDATGGYTLSVEAADLPTDGADLQSIAYGESHEGHVEYGDGRDPAYGDLAEPVEFEGEAGDDVEIEMTSRTFDTYLVLSGPGGDPIAEGDDGAGGTDSLLTASLSEDGTHTVWAGSFSGDATGGYTLSLERG